MAIRKGTAGNDTLFATSLNEQFDGLTGYDVVSYANSTAGVVVNLSNAAVNSGDAAGDTFTAIENFKLSKHNDTFTGTNLVDITNGDAGNDILFGLGGNDSLTGHSGNDTIYGGDGNDAIWGGGNNDVIQGGAGNDLIKADAHNDTIQGGLDGGSIDIARVFQVTPTTSVLASQIDDYGEQLVVAKYHNITNASQVTSLLRVGGDVIFVVTNGFSTARDWNAVIVGNGNLNPIINLGPGGVIAANTSVIFNAGPAPSTVQFVGLGLGAPGPKSGGSNAEGVVAKINAVTFGDNLTGGSDADRFVYASGDGVDRINDFQAALDRIDLASNWFDGNKTNGEYEALSYAGGTMIVFTDTSADGFVDNSAIYLAGIASSAVTNSIFI